MAAGKRGRFVESSPEQIEALEQSLEPLTADADAPPDTKGQPGRVSPKTYVLFAVVILFQLIPSDEGPGPSLNVVFSGLAGIFALASLGLDLTCPSARRRHRSRDAVRCYFKAVKHGRWRAALACLSQRARDETVRVPLIEELGSVPRETKLDTPANVSRYWYTISGAGGLYRRWIRKLSVEKLSGSEHVHRYRVALQIGAYESKYLMLLVFGLIPGLLAIYLLCTRVWRTEFEVFAFRHKSQWWLVSGAVGQLQQAAELPKARVVPR